MARRVSNIKTAGAGRNKQQARSRSSQRKLNLCNRRYDLDRPLWRVGHHEGPRQGEGHGRTGAEKESQKWKGIKEQHLQEIGLGLIVPD